MVRNYDDASNLAQIYQDTTERSSITHNKFYLRPSKLDRSKSGCRKRLVHAARKLAVEFQRRCIIGGKDLGEDHAGDVLGGIEPEIRVGHASPT